MGSPDPSPRASEPPGQGGEELGSLDPAPRASEPPGQDHTGRRPLHFVGGHRTESKQYRIKTIKIPGKSREMENTGPAWRPFLGLPWSVSEFLGRYLVTVWRNVQKSLRLLAVWRVSNFTGYPYVKFTDAKRAIAPPSPPRSHARARLRLLSALGPGTRARDARAIRQTTSALNRD